MIRREPSCGGTASDAPTDHDYLSAFSAHDTINDIPLLVCCLFTRTYGRERLLTTPGVAFVTPATLESDSPVHVVVPPFPVESLKYPERSYSHALNSRVPVSSLHRVKTYSCVPLIGYVRLCRGREVSFPVAPNQDAFERTDCSVHAFLGGLNIEDWLWIRTYDKFSLRVNFNHRVEKMWHTYCPSPPV